LQRHNVRETNRYSYEVIEGIVGNTRGGLQWTLLGL
jgi:hypothetical protein